MERIWTALGVGLAILAGTNASALDLRWSSGASNLTFTSTTRCTLEVRADSGAAHLPPDWRLLWVADGWEFAVVPQGDTAACNSGVSEVVTFRPPTDPAELNAHRTDILLCSTAATAPPLARVVMDLPGNGHGKFKVVALDPDDPAGISVLESSEASFNGGVADAFAPAVLRANPVHQSTDYRLRLIGAELQSADSVRLDGADGLWQQSLDIDTLSTNLVVASAQLAALVPASIAHVEASDLGFSRTSLDEELSPLAAPDTVPASCQKTYEELLLGPEVVQPKDFAFVPGGWTPSGNYVSHLFYIRQNQNTKNYPQLHGGLDFTEKNIGHAVADYNFVWSFVDAAHDTAAIAVRPGRFDSKHVWAPHIVRRGVTYYMFYTGVDGSGHQRMGLATSTDLFNWAQRVDPIIDYTAVGGWAAPLRLNGQAQFRDPFVMEDPTTPGQWLMFYVSIPAVPATATGAIVGYSKSPSGDFTQWQPGDKIDATRDPDNIRDESPHAFYRQGKWWLFYTLADENTPRIFGIANSSSPIDPVTANWSSRADIDSLIVDYVYGLPANEYAFWKGSELLELSTNYDLSYLAAYDDLHVGISYIKVTTAESPRLFRELCSVNTLGAPRGPERRWEPRLTAVGALPMRESVDLSIELPAAAPAKVTVFDVAGRKIRTLLDGYLPAGRTKTRWDGRDDGGASVGSGVYFASLTGAGMRRSLRVPVVR